MMLVVWFICRWWQCRIVSQNAPVIKTEILANSRFPTVGILKVLWVMIYVTCIYLKIKGKFLEPFFILFNVSLFCCTEPCTVLASNTPVPAFSLILNLSV